MNKEFEQKLKDELWYLVCYGEDVPEKDKDEYINHCFPRIKKIIDNELSSQLEDIKKEMLK